MDIQVKRIYTNLGKADGEFRILVDRLWPRGMSKEHAALDLWAKDIAPSNELRTWFSHDPEKFEEFQARYQAELEKNSTLPDFINNMSHHKNIVLLYGAKDEEHNHAIVLQDFLSRKLS